ncbi:hypothetical protein C4566_01530 [Candidatus Parcubacteria bacterium]|nr:MAG: hypothetical protein C4566_01530 [Candidatus Parcubacteria bacterium]
MLVKIKNLIFNRLKKLNTVMSVGVVLLWMILLASSNYANGQTLMRNELNKNIRLAEDTYRLLDTSVSELQTTERLENESARLNLVRIKTEDMFYIDNSQGSVALK